jgi:hypothetical protein
VPSASNPDRLILFLRDPMTLTHLNYQEIDALLAILESSDWCYLTELTEADIPLLYDKLTEMRDEI